MSDLRAVKKITSEISQCRNWSSATSLLWLAVESMLQVDVAPYNAAMNVCDKASQWQVAWCCFTSALNRSLKPSRITYSIIVSAVGKSLAWEDTLNWLLRAEEEYGLDIKTRNAGITACQKASEGNRALMLFEEIPPDQRSIVSYGAAISAISGAEWGATEQWAMALQLLEEVKIQRLELNIIVVNAAISACEKSGQWQQALVLFEDLEVQQLRSTVVSVSSIISALATASDSTWPMALHLLHHMAPDPTIVTYNAAITACGKGKQWEKALVLLEDSQQSQNLSPSEVTYAALVTACAEAAEWPKALQILMLEDAIYSQVAYNSAISACEKTSMWQMALTLLMHLIDLNDADIMSYNSAISACEKAIEWRVAIQLLEDLVLRDLEPTCVTASAVISACATMAKWFEALQLFWSSYEVQNVNEISCNAAINACAMASEWTKACELLEIIPTSIGYSSSIDACRRALAWQGAVELLRSAQEQSLRPDATACSLVVSACQKAMKGLASRQVLARVRCNFLEAMTPP